jgi:hypothetical protein
MATLTLLLTSVIYVTSVSGHSWITCTDYLEENGDYWDAALCRAFPRHGAEFTSRTGQFGADKGYNVINPPNNAPCRTRRDDAKAYDGNHPIAVYFPGQNVVITHPTKVQMNLLAYIMNKHPEKVIQ